MAAPKVHDFSSPADSFLEWDCQFDSWPAQAPPIPGRELPPGLINTCFFRTGWTIRQCTTPKLAGLSADVSSVPEPKTMGYGFDDGPNCTHNAFYNFLASQNQKATMYYVGSHVLEWPLEAQRAIADGHEICARKCQLAISIFY